MELHVFVFMCWFRFHKHISERTGASVEEQSEAVQEFYTVSSVGTTFPLSPLSSHTSHLSLSPFYPSLLPSLPYSSSSLSPSLSLPPTLLIITLPLLPSSPQSMSQRLTTHTLFRDMGEEQQEDMMDGIEKHLMTSIYPT